jgi:hypothetical protein
VVVPRARAGSTFSTSGLFIPEISNPRPFVCSPPRLSPRAGRAAGEPVKREGSAEASHAVRPRRTRELSLSRSRRRGRLGPPRLSDRNNPTPCARFGVPGWHVSFVFARQNPIFFALSTRRHVRKPKRATNNLRTIVRTRALTRSRAHSSPSVHPVS